MIAMATERQDVISYCNISEPPIELESHQSDVTWVSRNLIATARRLSVQMIVGANKKKSPRICVTGP